MKTAIVHDWLVGFAGGEKVLEALLEILDAPIYTLFKDKKIAQASPFSKCEIHTSFLQKLPLIQSYYRNLLPLFPSAIKSLDLSPYKLILSCSHAVAKGAMTRKDQCHICYCFTPMRYAWDLYDFHLSHLSPGKKLIARPTLKALRRWDHKSAPRVDHFVAISHYIAARIKNHYGCDAEVIYPPVDTHLFDISSVKEDYYFACSRFVPYKRFDIIIEAFRKRADRRLIIIGTGPEEKKLKATAPPNVEFLGHQPASILRKTLSKARAFVFAAEEDFGIVNVEAQSAGIPVIAYGRGGALETIVSGQTGLFFKEQTPESLLDALAHFEKMEADFDPKKIKKHAEKFSKLRFQQEMQDMIQRKLKNS